MTVATERSQPRMEGTVNVQSVVADTDAGIDVDPAHTAQLRVERIQRAAENINLLTLVDPDGAMLPSWDAGAHLELVLPSGLRRQYSLCGDPGDRYCYTMAVLRVGDGRGGSIEIHDTGLVGRTVEIRGPINRFGLVDASSYLLVAGGIGVTPIIAMARELHRRGAAWRMVYGARSTAAMAFTAELSALPEHVSLMTEDVEGIPDVTSLIASQPHGTAVYCCGPEPMLRAVEQSCAATPSVTLHTERFAPSGKVSTPAAGGNAPFDIELKRRGVVVHVGPEDNALDVVREVVRNHPYSCHEGMCGSCEVSVLGGKVDHRDDILSDEERAANDVMMLCVSRALSDRLVIDL
jgi:tetrachlorobenzoquinone reductase